MGKRRILYYIGRYSLNTVYIVTINNILKDVRAVLYGGTSLWRMFEPKQQDTINIV